MRLKAMAKINLGLDVLGKRPDGYHDVRMIMQTISMYDVLEMERTEEEGIFLSTNLFYVPEDSRNLVWKAVRLMMDEYHLPGGVKINLQKFIPVSAGLAGGSSDAAAALVGMDRLFGLRLAEEELLAKGLMLGADVPFCIMRGTALAEGIGEKLRRLPDLPDCLVLVAKPGVSVSTKMAYENLKLSPDTEHPDIDGMIRCIENGDLFGVAERMKNVFEDGICEKHPVVRKIKEQMKSYGAVNAMMSGSGPSVFGIFDDRAKIERAAQALRSGNLCRTVYSGKVFHNSKKGEMRD